MTEDLLLFCHPLTCIRKDHLPWLLALLGIPICVPPTCLVARFMTSSLICWLWSCVYFLSALVLLVRHVEWHAWITCHSRCPWSEWFLNFQAFDLNLYCGNDASSGLCGCCILMLMFAEVPLQHKLVIRFWPTSSDDNLQQWWDHWWVWVANTWCWTRAAGYAEKDSWTECWCWVSESLQSWKENRFQELQIVHSSMCA